MAASTTVAPQSVRRARLTTTAGPREDGFGDEQRHGRAPRAGVLYRPSNRVPRPSSAKLSPTISSPSSASPRRRRGARRPSLLAGCREAATGSPSRTSRSSPPRTTSAYRLDPGWFERKSVSLSRSVLLPGPTPDRQAAGRGRGLRRALRPCWRDAPALRGRAPEVEREVDRRRGAHAADRRQRREHQASALAKVAEVGLTPRLQT
jgi:hypothetical protein